MLLPLEFQVKAESQKAADVYAKSIFNSSKIIKMEADIYSNNNKVHYLIATDCHFEWNI